MGEQCPKCGNKGNTWINHVIPDDAWYSVCRNCGYESTPTKNYDQAWKWKPSRPASPIEDQR